jgi:3-oxoacyl-[acyl-carrier protein] reductase
MPRPLALITGGTSGIGYAVAQKLVHTNDLALSYLSNHDRAHAAADTLHTIDPGARIELLPGRIQSVESAHCRLENVIERLDSHPSTVILCSGSTSNSLFLSAPIEHQLTLLHEHLIASMAIVHAVLPRMQAVQYGRIVCMSSVAAHYAWLGKSGYAAAKAGIEEFVKTLAQETQGNGISIFGIAPGLIATPLTEQQIATLGTGIQKIPAMRVGQPHEIADLIYFLCQRFSTGLSGHTFVVDGGLSLR